MIVIIGAGISGLTCARYLKEKGKEFLVLEASDTVGGRVKTDTLDGFRLDHGFQVFLTSYPEARKILSYDAVDFQKIPSGARIRSGNEFFNMPNPLKNLMAAPEALMSPVGSFGDKLKVLGLNMNTSGQVDPMDNRDIRDQSTLEFLEEYGFSDKMIDQFFVPFFRGVFLDRKLRTNSGFFKFLYSQFSKGDVVVPKNGMQEIPNQLAAQAGDANIRLGTRVAALEGTRVVLDDGETIKASKVIVATDAGTADRLLGTDSVVEFNKTECLYFTSDQKLDVGGHPFLIINSNEDEIIDHVFLASDCVSSYSESGKTLISANAVGGKTFDLETVQAELSSWFGISEWTHLKTYKIPEALPKFDSASNGLDLKISEDIYRCGDYTAYPSLNGAMKSGRRVSELVSV